MAHAGIAGFSVRSSAVDALRSIDRIDEGADRIDGDDDLIAGYALLPEKVGASPAGQLRHSANPATMPRESGDGSLDWRSRLR